ncbi:MAG: FixH family protein [Anaerolineae bacterium]|jgi:copper transport protein|nr:FixH family protein [Anaerolineae bacterium]
MRLLKLLLALSALLVVTVPVHAHANLIDSIPSPGSTLFEPPPTLLMTFTEPVEAGFARVRVFDSDGGLIEMGDLTLSPDTANTLLADFPTDLPAGLYTVSWRVVSASDGHPTEGAFTFGVGEVMVTGGAGSQPQVAVVASQSVIVRWLNLVSLGLLIGWLGFRRWVWEAASQRIFWVAWGAVGIAGALFLLNQATVVADSDLWAAPTWGALGAVLGSSAFGTAWLVRMSAWLVIGALAARQQWTWALAAGSVLSYAQALTSHAAATGRLEAVVLDALHVAAMGMWLGGLITFGWALWRGGAEPYAATLTQRFSMMARVCVAVLALTGLYSVWLHVGSVEALQAASYGVALVVKNVLFVAMLILAGINLVFTGPMLKRGKAEWVRVLRGLVMFEIILGGGVLAASAWMTSDMPAAEAYRLQQAQNQPAPTSTSFFEMQVVGENMLHLDIVPGTVGENTFTVTLFNPDGSPMVDATRVSLRFTHLGNLVGESTLQLEHAGFGAYRATGANLSVPGEWRARLTVRQPGQFDVVTDFTVNLR